MDYSLIKPKKDKELIRYYYQNNLVGVFNRRPPRRLWRNKLTRKQFESQLVNKVFLA